MRFPAAAKFEQFLISTMLSRCLLRAAKPPLICPQFQLRLSHSHHHGHGHSHGSPSSSLSEQKLQASRLGSGPLRRITVVGAGVNVALAVGKAVAGVLGNSAAMIADAAHSLSDLVSDAVTLFVLKQAHKPADSDHPYGHGKFESIGSLSMAALLVGTGGAIGWHSIQVLTALHSATAEAAAAAAPTSLALGAAIASVLIKEGLYHATLQVGQKHNSSVVVMNAWHHRVDGLTSLVALVGIGGSMLGIPAADPIAGILVAGAIVKVGIDSGVDSFHDLTDQQIDGSVRSEMESLIAQEKGVRSFHKLRLRRTGPSIVADVHIVVDSMLSVSAAHQIAEQVRFNVMSAMHNVSDLLVHIDVGEDADTEDRLDASDLARHVHDIEADCRVIAAAFPAFQEISSITCHLYQPAPDAKSVVAGRHVHAVLKVRLSANTTLDGATSAALELRSKLIADVHDVREASIDVDLAHLASPPSSTTEASKRVL